MSPIPPLGIADPRRDRDLREFLSYSPALIGTVECEIDGRPRQRVRFYEHPILGDEHPLLAVLPGRGLVNSDSYDLPCADEIEADDYHSYDWNRGPHRCA